MKTNKQTGVLSKKILRYLLIAGTISIAATSPYFVRHLLREISKETNSKDKRRYYNSFYYLKKAGLIEVEQDGHDIHVHLTKEGEWRTGKFEFNELEVVKPKKWDRKWRVVIFDIPHEHRLKRDVFRRKLKELGFYSLQKSVWVHPYECSKEIKFLREFLDLSESDIRTVLAERIEGELELKKSYSL